jgi:hypothetical protein
MYQTNQYEGMLAETVAMQGHKGETIMPTWPVRSAPGRFPAWC